jgi:hypothetical protein
MSDRPPSLVRRGGPPRLWPHDPEPGERASATWSCGQDPDRRRRPRSAPGISRSSLPCRKIAPGPCRRLPRRPQARKRDTPVRHSLFAECVEGGGPARPASSRWSLAAPRRSPPSSWRIPLCRKITFTGSTEVGQVAHPRRRRRGSSPCPWSSAGTRPILVFADADLGQAVEAGDHRQVQEHGAVLHRGESASTYRALEIYEPFLERFAEAGAGAESRRPGLDGRRPGGARSSMKRWPGQGPGARRGREEARRPPACAEASRMEPAGLVRRSRRCWPTCPRMPLCMHGGDLRPGRRRVSHSTRRTGGGRACERVALRPEPPTRAARRTSAGPSG